MAISLQEEIVATLIEAHHGSGRREEERNVVRWCFADQKTAADFAAAFGGTVA